MDIEGETKEMAKIECLLCGIEGTKQNEHSVCQWSLLRTHHWVREDKLESEYLRND